MGSCSKPSLRVPVSKWLLSLTPSCHSVTWSTAQVQQCPLAVPQHHRGVCQDNITSSLSTATLQDHGSVLVEGTGRSQGYPRCQRPTTREFVSRYTDYMPQQGVERPVALGTHWYVGGPFVIGLRRNSMPVRIKGSVPHV